MVRREGFTHRIEKTRTVGCRHVLHLRGMEIDPHCRKVGRLFRKRRGGCAEGCKYCLICPAVTVHHKLVEAVETTGLDSIRTDKRYEIYFNESTIDQFQVGAVLEVEGVWLRINEMKIVERNDLAFTVAMGTEETRCRQETTSSGYCEECAARP